MYIRKGKDPRGKAEEQEMALAVVPWTGYGIPFSGAQKTKVFLTGFQLMCRLLGQEENSTNRTIICLRLDFFWTGSAHCSGLGHSTQVPGIKPQKKNLLENKNLPPQTGGCKG